MRGAPPFECEVGVSVVWRAGIAVVALAAVFSLVAWLLTAPDADAPWVRLAGSGAVVGVIAVAASLWLPPARHLRFDGAGWSIEPRGPSRPALAGRLDVGLDLGGFLLLRFRPETGGAARWLPLDRRGRGAGWHALRAQVYTARGIVPEAADAPWPRG